MQGSTHFTQTLSLTALLIVITIQATFVVTSPAGVSAPTNGASGPQLKIGNSPRSMEQLHSGIPDDKSRSNSKEGGGNEAVSNGTANTLQSLVDVALGSLEPYKQALKKAIMDSIEKDVAAKIKGNGALLRRLTAAKYENTAFETGTQQRIRRSSSEGQPIRKSSVVSLDKSSLVGVKISKGRRENEIVKSAVGNTKNTAMKVTNAGPSISQGQPSKNSPVFVPFLKQPSMQGPVRKSRSVRSVSGGVPSSDPHKDSFRRVVGSVLVKLDGENQALRKDILHVIEEVKGSGVLGHHRKSIKARSKAVAIL